MSSTVLLYASALISSHIPTGTLEESLQEVVGWCPTFLSNDILDYITNFHTNYYIVITFPRCHVK